MVLPRVRGRRWLRTIPPPERRRALLGFIKKLITLRCGAGQNHPFRTNPIRRILPETCSVATFGRKRRQETKSRNFNTCKNWARNSRRISTSIFQDLNMPRINTSRKTPSGESRVLWAKRSFCSSGRTARVLPGGRPEAFSFSRFGAASTATIKPGRICSCGDRMAIASRMNTCTKKGRGVGSGTTRSKPLRKVSLNGWRRFTWRRSFPIW